MSLLPLGGVDDRLRRPIGHVNLAGPIRGCHPQSAPPPPPPASWEMAGSCPLGLHRCQFVEGMAAANHVVWAVPHRFL
jgi:hypothetical protein